MNHINQSFEVNESMGKIKLTTAQALIKFLNQQYIHVDGKEFPFVEGIFSLYNSCIIGIAKAAVFPVPV